MSSLSFTNARWELTEVSDTEVHRLAKSTGLSPAAATILAGRWMGKQMPDPTMWLNPSIDHLHDPLLMLNMKAALERLQIALNNNQRIRIITDYDVDGTTSSLILQAALRLRKPDIDISYHIPNRFGEGYGFSVIAAELAIKDEVDLIITADIGVRDHRAVDVAKEGGVDVLICDHHLPAGAAVPENALVLCPPQVGCTYPNPKLAACGVSLKLAQGLLEHHHPKWPLILNSLLKLGAIGTVADLVPLTTLENRAIVSLGLKQLNAPRHHAGLKALLDVCRLKPGSIGTSDLGYRIGPRINAAGRLDDAKLVVKLFNERDPVRATELADRLELLNKQRQELQKRLVKETVTLLADSSHSFVVLAGPEQDGWHRGVVGIVASRVKDEVHRPVAIVSVQGEYSVGSVRSVPGVHAVQALDSVSDLLVKYGGHPMAAGFTVKTENIDALRERLCAFVDRSTEPEDLIWVRDADTVVPLEAVGYQLYCDLERLGPFGMGHQRPLLLIKNVRAKWVDVKASGRLLKLGLQNLTAIWWDRADLAQTFKDHSVDLLAELSLDTYAGKNRVQLQIKDARLATSPSS